jgi:hypothetical protein
MLGEQQGMLDIGREHADGIEREQDTGEPAQRRYQQPGSTEQLAYSRH